MDSLAARRVLDCFARVRPVTLNGRPVADLAYRFSIDPRTGARGVIAYLAAGPLPQGPNELVVGVRNTDGGMGHFPIPFWR